jgi:hypothetical protein
MTYSAETIGQMIEDAVNAPIHNPLADLLADDYGRGEDPRLPAHQTAAVGERKVRKWRIHPMSFIEQVLSLSQSSTNPKEWYISRMWEQVWAELDDGTEHKMTHADVQALTIAAGQHLISLVRIFGDLRSKSTDIVRNGNGLDSPLVLAFGDLQPVTISIETWSELESIAAKGNVVEQAASICELAGINMYRLAPAEGWWLLKQVREPLQKECAKLAEALRSYEFALKLQFHPDTPIGVLIARQKDYSSMFKKRAAAQKAASAKAKRKK